MRAALVVSPCARYQGGMHTADRSMISCSRTLNIGCLQHLLGLGESVVTHGESAQVEILIDPRVGRVIST
jgi:hypothetical protein